MPWPYQGISAAEPKVSDCVPSFSKEESTCSNPVSNPVKSDGEQHLAKKPSGDSLSVQEEGAISTNAQTPTSTRVVQYTRIDSSRRSHVSTRLTGSLVARDLAQNSSRI